MIQYTDINILILKYKNYVELSSSEEIKLSR